MGLNQQRAELQPAALPFELRKRGAQRKIRTFKLLFLRQAHVPILLSRRNLHSESRTHKSSGLSRLHIPILLCGVLKSRQEPDLNRRPLGYKPAGDDQTPLSCCDVIEIFRTNFWKRLRVPLKIFFKGTVPLLETNTPGRI